MQRIMHWLKRRWRIRVVMSVMMIVAITLTAVTLISVNWIGTRTLLLNAAASKAEMTSQITEQRVQHIVGPAEALLRVLALDPIVDATSLAERLKRLRVFATDLRANPIMTAVFIGYDNGDYFLVSPLNQAKIRKSYHAPARASFAVRTALGQDGKQRAHQIFFYDRHLNLLEQRPDPSYEYDPRQRPWYGNALNSKDLAISKPYLYADAPIMGITLSMRGSNPHSVVAMDIPLVGIKEALQKLSITPNSQIALVDSHGEIIAANTSSSTKESTATSSTLQLSTVHTLGNAALLRLWLLHPDHQVLSYRSDDQDWLGRRIVLSEYRDLGLQLLIATPTKELLKDLYAHSLQMILIAIGLGLLLLAFGAWLGHRIGQVIEQHIQRVRQMSNFDFSRLAPDFTMLYEAYQLTDVTDDVGRTMEALLKISQVLQAEPHIETMLDQVLKLFVEAARCDSGAVYLYHQEDKRWNKTASCGQQSDIDAISTQLHLEPDLHLDKSATCQNFAIRGRQGDVLGHVILKHAGDQEHRSRDFLIFSERLTGMLAIPIETRQLIESQKALLDAFILVLADAIDIKSAHTGGHCRRVPKLAMMFVDQLSDDTEGRYADFQCINDDREAFRLAAWLHDCGKITSPEHIIDKATKLETIYNRIHEIRTRFEVLRRDAQIASLDAQLAGTDLAIAEAKRDAQYAQLEDDFAFVAQCNIGSEFLSDDAIARLEKISQQTWLRYFDDTLGLSALELARYDTTLLPPTNALPVREPLLADKLEHLVPWDEAQKPVVEKDDPRNIYGFDMQLPPYQRNNGEIYNLNVRRGTLTNEDRFAINNHIVQTLIMLTKLPWPKHLQRIPDLATNHHERMDGNGYPRRLHGSQMSIEERVLAVADVFEALTATDRPYKSAKTISESLAIMAKMSKENHLDSGLFIYFLNSRLWLDYAHEFIPSEQIDEVNIDELVRMAS
ncbi:MAG: HD domain-containing protein [Candidatus Saccharibacteria bacterium]|nr:HD domain-containing protein [Moraxellaceae bacterium]